MIDITQLSVALIGLLAAVITTVAVPWIKSKVSESQWYRIMSVARVAVQAAEQLGATKAISDKLTYAMEHAAEALMGMGIKVNLDTLRAAIEAAVRDMNAVA